jgi:hypothetical protein
MHTRTRITFIAAAAILASQPAFAFDTRTLGYGSLFVSDFMSVIKSSPKLEQELVTALAAAKQTPEDQLCEAPRFPGPWKHLRGEHVAPFTCHIGDKWLQIRATLQVTGPKRVVYEAESAAAAKRADKISQTHLQWTWTSEDPRKSN